MLLGLPGLLACSAGLEGMDARDPAREGESGSPRHRLTLQVHEDEPRRVGLLAVQRPAGPVQDVGAQLPGRLFGVGRFAQRSILGRRARRKD